MTRRSRPEAPRRATPGTERHVQGPTVPAFCGAEPYWSEQAWQCAARKLRMGYSACACACVCARPRAGVSSQPQPRTPAARPERRGCPPRAPSAGRRAVRLGKPFVLRTAHQPHTRLPRPPRDSNLSRPALSQASSEPRPLQKVSLPSMKRHRRILMIETIIITRSIAPRSSAAWTACRRPWHRMPHQAAL
jgi:hypothetical protein